MMTSRIILSFFVFFVACSFVQAQNKTIVLQGATVIDSWNNVPLTDESIVIVNNTIMQVGKKFEVRIPTNAIIVNLEGKFIMPGIIDVDARYTQPEDLTTMFSFGITTANILTTDPEAIQKLKQESEKDSTLLPELYVTVPISLNKRGWKLSGVMGGDSLFSAVPASPAAAREQIKKIAARGINRICLIDDAMQWCNDSLPPEQAVDTSIVLAMIDEARKQNIFVALQAPAIRNGRIAIFAGASALNGGILDDRLVSDAVSQMSYIPTYYVSTLTRYESYADPKGVLQRIITDSLFRNLLPQAVRNRYSSAEYSSILQGKCSNSAYVKAHLSVSYDNTLAIVTNYQPIPLGTNLPELPGVADHLEMEYLVKAGLTPMQTIVTSTGISAEYLGIRSKLGFIFAKCQADLLVLDKNPIDDIRNTRSITMIMKNGIMYDAKTLRKVELK